MLRIDQLASVATPDHQSDRSKISILLRVIERTPWFIAATAGTDRLPHYTSVVERINHELARMAAYNPNFSRPNPRSTSDRMRIVREVLYAIGEDDSNSMEDANAEGADDDDTEIPHENNDDHVCQGVLFESQRQYGKTPARFRNRTNSRSGNRGGRFQVQSRFGSSDNHPHPNTTPYDRRCFNCGSPGCTVTTCKEPGNQARIEANLTAWRKSRGIDRPLRHVNLADINAPFYLIAEAKSAEIYLVRC